MEMDWSVGQITKALADNGILNNTIIFFTSDNGPFLERGKRGGFQGRGIPGHCDWKASFVSESRKMEISDDEIEADIGCGGTVLKGGKAQTWEGGIRVPSILSWPGKISAGSVYRHPVYTMDVFSTFAR